MIYLGLIPFTSLKALLSFPSDTTHFGSAHVPEHWPKQFSPANKGRRWSSWPNSGHFKIRHLILGYSPSCLPLVDEK